jgi:uncharacterized protein (DUF952 family)
MTTLVLEHLQHADSASPDITIDSSGRIGIGTSSPQKILHTYGSGPQQLRVQSPDSTSELYLLASGTNTSYLSNSNNLQIWTNGGRAITVDASQNVGIGTSSPSFGAGGFGLEVKGTGRPTLRVTEETNTHAVQLSATDGAAILESRSSGMDLVFGTSGVEKIRIDDTNGYVHMNSASQIRLTLGNEGTPGTNNANWIRGNQGYLQYNAANNAHTWEVGGTERMRLHPGGQFSLPYQPSFSAHKTSHLALSGAGSAEAGTWSDSWMNGAHNTGGHFNTTTGRFTVPIDGRYKFDANIMHGNTSGDYQVWICVNGNTSTCVKSNDMTNTGGSWKQTTVTGIFNLAANDYISIFIRSSTAESYAIYGTASAAFTTCNGYLIG